MNSIGATAEFQLRKPQKLFLTKVFYSDKERTNRLVYLRKRYGSRTKGRLCFHETQYTIINAQIGRFSDRLLEHFVAANEAYQIFFPLS